MDYLSQIKSILDEKEFSKIKELGSELLDSWNKNQIFRTETEARFSVLNDAKYPTKASKYWQSVREQMCHFNELVGLSFEMRRKRIDLKEVEKKLKSAYGFDRERLEIDREELMFALAHGDRVAKDRVREVLQWSMLKKEVNDGSFDDKNVNTHQKESLFLSVLNRMQVAPQDMSAEEKLSIGGIYNMLKKEPVNEKIVENIEKNSVASKN